MLPDLNQVEIEWLGDFSLKVLCLKIFHEIDKLADTNYWDLYIPYRQPLDQLLSNIARIAQFHDLVVIVVTNSFPLEHTTGIGRKKMREALASFEDVTGLSVVFTH